MVIRFAPNKNSDKVVET